MVRRNKNNKPRLNWKEDDDEHSYLYDDYDNSTPNHSSLTAPERTDHSNGTMIEVTPTAEISTYCASNSAERGKEVSATPLNDVEEVNEIQEFFDDVTLNDNDILELASSDDLAIEKNSALSNENSDETSVIHFDREINLERQESGSSYENDYDWDVLTDIQSLKNSNSLYSMNEDDWDALSSVNSVMSIETFQSSANKLSYKDMVTKKSSSSNVTHNKMRKPCLSKNSNLLPKEEEMDKESPSLPHSKVMLSIDENNCSDVYQEYEGYKCSRGGKDALKFRGNDRHQRGRTTSSYKYHTKNYRKGTSRNCY